MRKLLVRLGVASLAVAVFALAAGVWAADFRDIWMVLGVALVLWLGLIGDVWLDVLINSLGGKRGKKRGGRPGEGPKSLPS